MLGTLEIVVLLVLLVLGLALRRLGARGWLVLGALMLTCFVTNPDKAKHATAINEPLLQYHYSNLGFFSVTAANRKLVSVGFLNQVFVPST